MINDEERVIKVQEDETEVWEYQFSDGKIYSRHRGKGAGCFFTEWEVEFGSNRKEWDTLPYTDIYSI